MSDVVIRYSIPDYKGSMTHIPPPTRVIDGGWDYPPPDYGDRTLEFDLQEDQRLPIEIPGMRICILVYKDRFEVVKMKVQEEVQC